jgi:hypothetical protein
VYTALLKRSTNRTPRLKVLLEALEALELKCKGYYCGHLGLPSGQAPDTPRTSVGHVPEARARSI